MNKVGKNVFVFLFVVSGFLFVEKSQTTDDNSPLTDKADSLTIEQFIQLALQNNPRIKLAQSNLDAASANLMITRSPLFPQINLQSGWTKNGGTFFIGPTARPGGFQNYSAGFQLQQLIFDFGKTYSRISASSELENAVQSDLLSVKQDLILNVYTAYFNFLQFQRLRNVNEDLLKQAEDHLKEAESFYKVGKVPQFDVLRAQTDLQNAKVNLLNSENNIKLGKIQLENIINTKLPERLMIKDILEIKQETIDESTAFNNAINNRPEFISSKLRVEASKSLVNSAWTANLPSINAVGGYQWRSYSFDSNFVSSWNIGLSLTLPIFQGFALDAALDEAKANLKNAEAQNDIILQGITLDVQQQYTNLLLAQSKIEALLSLVKQSEETLKLAEGRYKSGVGSPIEITDARVSLFNSKTLYIQSLDDYQVGYVRLQRAMGTLK